MTFMRGDEVEDDDYDEDDDMEDQMRRQNVGSKGAIAAAARKEDSE